jgi:hypothetical protein
MNVNKDAINFVQTLMNSGCTIVCREPSKGNVNFASFDQAQKYVRSTGPAFDLEDLGGLYVVRRNNQAIGKGMHYNTAIADAESNL